MAHLSRPEDLPDYRSPPIAEVVLGVQFQPPRNYQQIYAGRVWDLYRADFPIVEEQQAIMPQFETFGPGGNILQPQIGIITGARHDRFWFLTERKDELIQFQQDRLLHNWRKVEKVGRDYPRFEAMVQAFERELRLLERFVAELAPQKLSINQAEISYINHIPSTYTPGQWFKFIDFGDQEIDDFAVRFRRTMIGDDGSPQGRLVVDAGSGHSVTNERILMLTLTARGAPTGTEIPEALDFLARGREAIINLFTAITTDSAHQIWGRVK